MPVMTRADIHPNRGNTCLGLGLYHAETVVCVFQESGFWSREFSFTTPSAVTSSKDTLRLLVASDIGHWVPDNTYQVNGGLPLEPTARLSEMSAPGTLKHVLATSASIARGDMNPQPASKHTMAAMLKQLMSKTHHGLIYTGDLSSARGQQAHWDDFFTQMTNITSQLPMMSVPGDKDSDSFMLKYQMHNNENAGGECGVPYEKRLRMPHSTMYEQWYSFNIGPVHFLQLSSEQNWTSGSSQHK